MDDLRRLKRQSLDDVVRLYAAKHLSAADELRAGVRSAQLRLRALMVHAAQRAETCAAKLRRVRATRAEADAKRRAVERLKAMWSTATTPARTSIQPEHDAITNTAVAPRPTGHRNLWATRHHLFEMRRRLAHELFTQIFTIDRVGDSNAGSYHADAAHEQKSSTNDATYFERHATVRRSCGDLSSYSKNRLPERQILTPILDQSGSELVEALTEASLTNFFVDRWFFMGRQQSTQRFKMVDWCVIDDFCHYDSWTPLIFGSSTDAPPITSETFLTHAPASGSLAALSYAARLVDGLARVFDVHLPSAPSAFFDAAGQTMDDSKFAALSLEFNVRVVALCAALGVTWQIHFSRPFHNLRRLAAACSSGGRARETLTSRRLAADDPPPPPDAVCWRDYRRALQAVQWPSSTSPSPTDHNRQPRVTSRRRHSQDDVTHDRHDLRRPQRIQRIAAGGHSIVKFDDVTKWRVNSDDVIVKSNRPDKSDVIVDTRAAEDDDEWEKVSGERLLDWSRVAPSTTSRTSGRGAASTAAVVDSPLLFRAAGGSAASLVNLVTSATASVVNLFKNANL